MHLPLFMLSYLINFKILTKQCLSRDNFSQFLQTANMVKCFVCHPVVRFSHLYCSAPTSEPNLKWFTKN